MPFRKSIHYDFGGYDKNVQYIGMVRDSSKDHMITFDVKATFSEGDTLECMMPNGRILTIQASRCVDSMGHAIQHSKPNSVIKMPMSEQVPRLSIIRKRLC